jgi:hypothetical protein
MIEHLVTCLVDGRRVFLTPAGFATNRLSCVRRFHDGTHAAHQAEFHRSLWNEEFYWQPAHLVDGEVREHGEWRHHTCRGEWTDSCRACNEERWEVTEPVGQEDRP